MANSKSELERWEKELLTRERALLQKEMMVDRPELTVEDVREAARTAANEVMIRMGVDPGEPLETQKDFQHLRSWRLATEKAKERTMLAVLGVIVTGALGALWVGLQEYMHRRP